MRCGPTFATGPALRPRSRPSTTNATCRHASDYGELAPGESITAQFDLFHYARPQRPGRYTVTIVYQADEPVASPPDGVVAGEHAADPITLEVS